MTDSIAFLSKRLSDPFHKFIKCCNVVSLGKKSAVLMPYLHSNNRRSLDYFNKSVSVEFGLLAVCHRLNHMGMLKCIASEKKPGQAVDAEHKFEKKTDSSPLSMEIKA